MTREYGPRPATVRAPRDLASCGCPIGGPHDHIATAKCGRTDPHGGHVYIIVGDDSGFTDRRAFCAGNVAIVEAVTAEDDAAMTREQRLAQTGDCPAMYPDQCPDVNTCPVHDDGTLFPAEDDAATSAEYPIEGGY